MNIKGQSLIEGVLMLPILFAFWVAIIFFARLFIIEIELMQAAHQGIFWMAYHTDASPSQQEQAQTLGVCRAFLQRMDPSLNASRLTFQIHPGDHWRPPSILKQLADVAKLIASVQLLGDLSQKEVAIGKVADWLGIQRNPRRGSVEITYDVAIPPLFRWLAGFPKSLVLRGFCASYR
jgi:hypothetical protein